MFFVGFLGGVGGCVFVFFFVFFSLQKEINIVNENAFKAKMEEISFEENLRKFLKLCVLM